MILVPAETPLTNPVLFTVATAGVAEVQGSVTAGVPEPANWVVYPTHTERFPVIVGFA